MKQTAVVLALFSFVAMSLGGCSGDEPAATGLAGSGGGTGGGGNTGAGGSAGRGGTTATAGTTGGAGTTGTGGTTGSAGATGAAGASGTAGQGGTGAAGMTGAAGTSGTAGRGGTMGAAGTSGSAGRGGIGGGAAGASGRGGTGGGAAGAAGGAGTTGSAGTGSGGSSGLPALSVSGNKLQDPSGKTIILRGSSLIDIGALYAYGGMSAAGINARLDKIAAAAVQGHVVRMPVYPNIDYNGGYPTCSPLPYPVGTGPAASCTPKMSLSAADYVSRVLTPAVDYATSKNLYVIIDFHQIDVITTGTSAADARTFWTDIAPRFANYTNVIYEPFNEPTEPSSSWAALKPVVQSFVNTIRTAAPRNIIIVPSHSWDQHPGDAANDPPTGTNLMYTAHIYPSNWSTAFQNQVATAVTKVPVFITEWGYDASDPASFGTGLRTTVDGNGASWTAWVTDNAWTPPMFADNSLTTLTNFGMLVKTWLAATANSNWVQ